MSRVSKLPAPRTLLKKAAALAVAHTFPAWIDATEYGVAQGCATPRVRDSLVLRLVAGRRQGRTETLVHAPGSP